MSPAVRVGLSMLPNLGLGITGVLLGAFDLSGALVGLVAGTVLTYAFGIGGFAVLLAFVVLGACFTALKYRHKQALGINQPRGGRRTWRSAVGNLLVPALGACAAIAGSGRLAGVFAVGSLATAAFDTVASEVGKALSGRSFSLHDMKVRPPGSPGGVSAVGTAAGAAGALGVCAVATVFELVDTATVIWILMAAAIGTMIESLLKSGAELRSAQAANLVNTATGGFMSVLIVALVERR